MTIRVLYNATSPRVGGGLSYARSQLEALAHAGDLSIDVYCSPWNASTFRGLRGLGQIADVRRIAVRGAGIRYLWEQFILPRHAREYDILLCPGNFAPLWKRTPTVTVLQNANYVGFGRLEPYNLGVAARSKARLCLSGMRSSDLVVLISESLAAEFRKEKSLANVRTTVIPSGHTNWSSIEQGASGVADINVAGAETYVLSVANDAQHKNLADIAAGWSRYRGLTGAEVGLLYVGAIGAERQSQLRDLASPHQSEVAFAGQIDSPAAIRQLYRRALAAISASSLEAFPLTIHEASSVGCPLVLSEIPAHVELAGDRATYFPTRDREGLALALQSALSKPRPPAWDWDFTWDQHAAMLSQALVSVCRSEAAT